MISADTNIFIHAARQESEYHEASRGFLQAQARNKDFALCELVLVELYMGLKNAAIFEKPLTSAQAVDYCEALRGNSNWRLLDYTPRIRDELWQKAREKNFAIRRIIDARLGLSLVYNGVKQFATANVKDFKNLGFEKVWNPLL